MPNADAPYMTYGEFTKRRTAILSEITTLQKKINVMYDSPHTMFLPKGGSIVELQLAAARERLTKLVADYAVQQRSEEKP